jgi:hypothetical protein
MAPDTFLVFSASLPLRFAAGDGIGEVIIVPKRDVRPWNGRVLTDAEVQGALRAADHEYFRTVNQFAAAQAAFEWLSEHAP